MRKLHLPCGPLATGPLLAALALLLLASSAGATSLLFEVRELNGINPPFSRYVYACLTCTEAEFAAVVPPANFEKASAKLFLPDGTATFPTIPGVAQSLDLVPGIPGDDFQLIAQVLSGSFVEFNATLGAFALAQVERDTQFTYAAGTVVHELIDTAGNVYILFTFQLDQLGTIDPTQVDALSGLPIPTGWSYRSRTLAQDLVIDSSGVATVFAQGGVNSWQRYAVVPEPGFAALLGAGALALRTLRRRRSG